MHMLQTWSAVGRTTRGNNVRAAWAAGLVVALGCVLAACARHADSTTSGSDCRNYLTEADLAPEKMFSNPLPIPNRLAANYTIPGPGESTAAPAATPVFVLHGQEYTWRPAPDVCIQKWGFEGTTPGPTLVVAPYQRSEVLVYNELPGTLYNPYLDPLNPWAWKTPPAPNGTRYTMFGPDPDRPPAPFDAPPYAMSQYALNPDMTVHLHGGHQTPANDGHPLNTFGPGESFLYDYPNNQEATTLWYHDHVMDRTRGHVLMGMAGFYLIEDDVADARAGLPIGEGCESRATPLPSDPTTTLAATGAGSSAPVECDDIPVMFQQIPAEMIDVEAYKAVAYPTPGSPAQQPYRALWTANNTLSPVLTVTNKPYRFRFLNGNDELPLTVWTTTEADDGASYPDAAFLQQVGADGGLMNRVAVADPPQTTKIKLFPAQRADVVIDFSSITATTTLYLQTATGQAFVGGDEVRCLDEPCPFGDDVDQSPTPLIKFIVEPTVVDPKPFAPPDGLLRGAGLTEPIQRTSITNDDGTPVTERSLLFSFTGNLGKNPFATVNGQFFDHNEVAAAPELGSTEVWHLINSTDGYHPIHIHDIEFQVLTRRRCPEVSDTEAQHQSDPDTPYDWCDSELEEWTPLPAEPGDWEDCPVNDVSCNLAWRDVFVVPPYSEVTIVGTFTDNLGVYVFHCHNLIHEDAGMMAQFEVIPVGGTPSAIDHSGHGMSAGDSPP